MNPPAGWHPDPYDPAIDRYWDGTQWTGDTRPKDTDPATQVIDMGGFDPAATHGADNGGVEPATELMSTGIPVGASDGQPGKGKPKWPWIVGGVLVAFLGLGAIGAATAKDEADPAPAAPTTTSSAAPTTTTTTTKHRPTTTVSIAPLVPQTTETATPTSTLPPMTTTTAAPAPTTGHTLEYSCSDAAWRESMGAEGDELCGAPWKPRTTRPAPAYTPPAAPQPAYTPPAPQQSSGTVHPGSFCSSPGATGVTTKGTSMVCGPGSDGKNRWKFAG
ncbi:DUF2510 domain-containing protein [Prescottella agglutinans]|uniref:DUF2510 domain-containing protein n=1 Tax=Prescottella agglutinans TaxID=1644129 RepID=A0ABT6MK31_9NOCA|nr:DUF2510 domain-containing protein [Prescottella agglutinans]MDH6284655.1 hypothetical protein [Prescottella agglutinans]